MGDPRRFELFGDLCAQILRPEMQIADVAGGKGRLRGSLYLRGFRNVTCWDRRKHYARGRRGYQYGHFDHRTAPAYDAVVAMHPDGGTDEAIVYAGERRVPAIICPCCAIPSATGFWAGKSDYEDWMLHLTLLAEHHGLQVTETTLPMQGRNRVLILRPHGV